MIHPFGVADLRQLPRPYEEGRLEVVEHHPLEPIRVDPRWLVPYLCERQQEGWSGIHGRYLLKIWKGLPTLNATALDYLLAQPHLKRWMPRSCTGLTLYFPRTMYIENRRELFLRYLDYDTWTTGDTLLDGFGFTSRCAALMLPGIRSTGTLNPLQSA